MTMKSYRSKQNTVGIKFIRKRQMKAQNELWQFLATEDSLLALAERSNI